jgi:uncharacterized membrane protein YphA (DoxX/SURF4 family)
MSSMAIRWSLPRRIAFRFAFPYVLLYSFGTIVGLIPPIRRVTELVFARIDPDLAVYWLTRHVFHTVVRLAEQPTGSGDTALEWARLACIILVAGAVCFIWSVLDRRRFAYPGLSDILRTLLRYVLATTMLSYGLAKMLPVQFPFPDASELIKSYADSSPMGLLWRFMGFSPAYVAFAGALECLGGVLLLWRRTTALGAFLLVGVLANVVMLNFCYDVPVKQYSAHLLLYAIALAAPDVPRLVRVLVLRRPPRRVPLRVPLPVWFERARPFVKVIVLAFLSYGQISVFRGQWAVLETRPSGGPVSGIWTVESVEPVPGDDARWRQLVVNRSGYARAECVNPEKPLQRYIVELDADRTTLTFKPQGGGDRLSLHYSRHGDRMELAGELGGQNVIMRMHRVDETRVPLVARGFHWVQERPYYR